MKEPKGKVLPFRAAESGPPAPAMWHNQVRVVIKDREPDPDFEEFLVSLGVEIWLAKNENSKKVA